MRLIKLSNTLLEYVCNYYKSPAYAGRVDHIKEYGAQSYAVLRILYYYGDCAVHVLPDRRGYQAAKLCWNAALTAHRNLMSVFGKNPEVNRNHRNIIKHYDDKLRSFDTPATSIPSHTASQTIPNERRRIRVGPLVLSIVSVFFTVMYIVMGLTEDGRCCPRALYSLFLL